MLHLYQTEHQEILSDKNLNNMLVLADALKSVTGNIFHISKKQALIVVFSVVKEHLGQFNIICGNTTFVAGGALLPTATLHVPIETEMIRQ